MLCYFRLLTHNKSNRGRKTLGAAAGTLQICNPVGDVMLPKCNLRGDRKRNPTWSKFHGRPEKTAS